MSVAMGVAYSWLLAWAGPVGLLSGRTFAAVVYCILHWGWPVRSHARFTCASGDEGAREGASPVPCLC